MGNLLTPDQWIDNPVQDFWVHGLALVSHILQGRKARRAWNGAYKDNTDLYMSEMVRAMEEHSKKDEGFNEVVEGCYRRKPRFIQRRGLEGDFDTDLWLARGGLTLEPGAPNDFFFEDVKVPRDDASTLTIVIDASIPYADRGTPHMAARHKQAYNLALKAEGEGRPCRVIAFSKLGFAERQDVRVITIVKDFDDPVFPGIWGIFSGSTEANAAINVYSNALFGTRSRGNAMIRFIEAQEIREQYFPGEEVVFAKPTTFIRGVE